MGTVFLVARTLFILARSISPVRLVARVLFVVAKTIFSENVIHSRENAVLSRETVILVGRFGRKFQQLVARLLARVPVGITRLCLLSRDFLARFGCLLFLFSQDFLLVTRELSSFLRDILARTILSPFAFS